ncbi:MAG: OmpA family protein, partial [Acetobacteraceae bacterium]
MNNSSKMRLLAMFAFIALLPGCVWQSDYDKLQAENQQLQQQVSSQAAEISTNKEQINRLVGAIKYTVNSDLVFAPGSWKMSARGQQIISGFAQKLAPTQQTKLLVAGYTDNTPIGPELMRQGVTSNQELSQKRADAVMAFLISQGVRPDLVEAKGFGEADPVSPNDTPAD